MASSKSVLIIASKRENAIDLAKELLMRGITVGIADSTESITAAVSVNVNLSAVFIDAAFSEKNAVTLLKFLRQSVPKQAYLLVDQKFTEGEFLQKLEESGVVKRVSNTRANSEGLTNEIVAVLTPGDLFFDTNIVNCFIQSTNDVIEYYFGELPEMMQATREVQSRKACGYVTGISVLQGAHFFGSAALTCNRDLIIDAAPRVSGTSRKEAADDEVVSATTRELCDQIFSRAIFTLNKLDFGISATVPEIIKGEPHVVCHKINAPVVCIPFKMWKRKFNVDFTLKKV